MTLSTSERVQKRRAALRAQGLRPVQIWVPDTRRPGFAEDCRRQAVSVATGDPTETDSFMTAAAAEIDGWD